MTSILLALVLVLPSPTQMLAHQTWDRISWEYQLPPATITVNAPWIEADAAYAGVDQVGRAIIGIKSTCGNDCSHLIAHEAAHALLMPTGMSVTEQHEWADDFATCQVGWVFPNRHSCDEVRAFFARFHR